MTFLRFLMLLSLVVWVGGIIFLFFVEAPSAFSIAPSRHMAGTLVGHTLLILHWMGLFSGVIFLGCSKSPSSADSRPTTRRLMPVSRLISQPRCRLQRWGS